MAGIDLAAWNDIATNVIKGGRFGGVDAAAGGADSRFYRAVVASPITGAGP